MNSAQEARARLVQVRRVLWRVLILNLLVAGAKMGVGYYTNTLSLLADGFHSTLDAASNIVGLIGVTAAARPPDEDHPYGHHKYETLASLVIGVLVLYTALEIVQESVYRLSVQTPVSAGISNVIVMIVTICINILVTRYEARAGVTYKSDILLADSLQTRSDVFVSCGVLLAALMIWAGIPIIDPIAAMLVTIAILYSAWLIFNRATHILSDRTSLPAADVEAAALSVPGVLSVEKIRSRGSSDKLSVDMHIRVDPQMSVIEAHRLTHDVRSKVEQATGALDVVIHTEPEDTRS